ncbi:hypothetical protein MFTT_50940 [Mycolicibacterium fortuitum subsp. fortuitum]|nr:hypothetical protein MFTT_50940 [Mycolicibacterium fortuitum subsp. fortuitum]CRL58310.1 hypothetical protein CPGR_05653 [Mycolicibacterium fortuitum subsp. fortuitum DSM 46621 = ATCC 6841 = JCM 6387]CRL82418.1 hypothetical protein CPGR_05640 [Mycolicibacter nonchromogenicus]
MDRHSPFTLAALLLAGVSVATATDRIRRIDTVDDTTVICEAVLRAHALKVSLTADGWDA